MVYMVGVIEPSPYGGGGGGVDYAIATKHYRADGSG